MVHNFKSELSKSHRFKTLIHCFYHKKSKPLIGIRPARTGILADPIRSTDLSLISKLINRMLVSTPLKFHSSMKTGDMRNGLLNSIMI